MVKSISEQNMVILPVLKKKVRVLDIFATVILFFAILGILCSIYLTWIHFAQPSDTFCSINEKFDCIAVSKSSFSTLFGIPVSIFGFVMYLIIGFLACCFLKKFDLADAARIGGHGD